MAARRRPAGCGEARKTAGNPCRRKTVRRGFAVPASRETRNVRRRGLRSRQYAPRPFRRITYQDAPKITADPTHVHRSGNSVNMANPIANIMRENWNGWTTRASAAEAADDACPGNQRPLLRRGRYPQRRPQGQRRHKQICPQSDRLGTVTPGQQLDGRVRTCVHERRQQSGRGCESDLDHSGPRSARRRDRRLSTRGIRHVASGSAPQAGW